MAARSVVPKVGCLVASTAGMRVDLRVGQSVDLSADCLAVK